MRYKRHSYIGLFGYIQLFIISNGVNTKYYTNNKNIKEMSFKPKLLKRKKIVPKVLNKIVGFVDKFFER